MATMRGYYLEEFDRATNNLEMCLTHLARIVEAYKEAHPEVSNPVKECGDAIVIIAETLIKIKETI